MSNYSIGRGRRENDRSNNSLGDYFSTNHHSDRDSEYADNRRSDRRGGRREAGNSRRSGNNTGLSGSERGFRRSSSYQRLPREEGMIVSLLESFGFIKCAEREEDVFFHYSEMDRNSYHANELEVGMEVDFDIGPSPQSSNRSSKQDQQKLAAFRVNVLPKGTVKWELPDEDVVLKKRGKVEKAARVQHSRSSDIRTSPYDGTIRLIVEDIDEDDSNNDDKDAKGEKEKRHQEIILPYSVDEYEPERTQPSRLLKGDLVEFETVVERRSKKKLAKNIRLIQSERDRQRELREQKMLAEATFERGVVVSLSDNDGFLRSASRREHVYFQYTFIELPDTETNANPDTSNEYTLEVGQDMEFLVCKEIANGRNQQTNRLVARKITFLPKGSVEFYQTISTGVVGVVSKLPLLPSPNRRRDHTHSNKTENYGKIRLKCPISLEDDEISEVILDIEDIPGGTYAANRDGSQISFWIREGDMLLFDIIKETLDGSFHAKPTQSLLPTNEVDNSNSDNGERKVIRLMQPSLAGRIQGTVSAVKEGYGFITCAERNADVYFRLYEIFPASLQSDIVRYTVNNLNSINMTQNSQQIPKVMVGTQVTFDLSVTSSGPQDHSRSRNNKHQNLENMKAQRVCLLPKDSFEIDIVIAENVQAVVTQEHKDKSGYLELKIPVTAMSRDQRHPLVSSLLDSIKETGETLIYPTVLGANEAQVVVSMAEQKGLRVGFVGGNNESNSPDPAINGYARLQISHPVSDKDNNAADENEMGKDQGHADDNDSASAHSVPTEENAKAVKTSSKKKSTKKTKPVKIVRFERSSIARGNKGGPPGVGDVVECNITQSRRTGAYSANNVNVIERKMVERNVVDAGESQLKSLGIASAGLVTEVVPARDFGFITQIDENSLKKEVLFFHMSSVVMENGDELPTNEVHEKPTRKHRGRHHDRGLIRKGDEVKFDIGKHEKSGKRIAMNVVILPQGTLQIPSKAEKNACKGIILMEPSHTSLSNTPLHATTLNVSQGKNPSGRWADVRDPITKKEKGSQMSEQGVILLVSDPSGHFNKSMKKDPPSDIENVTRKPTEFSAGEKTNCIPYEQDAQESKAKEISNDEMKQTNYIHIIYRSVGVAVRGAGSSLSVDAAGAPRRGDLVSFAKGKGSSMIAKDIRLLSRSSATTIQGHLESISIDESTATFVPENNKKEKYLISLKEIVSCDVKLLNESTKVEGILHEGKIYGVCRTTDLYLSSKVQIGKKQRPRLNLTVKKELQDMGGKIVAQSCLAKGPNGTNGFPEGWTNRVSKYDNQIEEEDKISREEIEIVENDGHE